MRSPNHLGDPDALLNSVERRRDRYQHKLARLHELARDRLLGNAEEELVAQCTKEVFGPPAGSVS